jgi:hypothetical protein
MPLLKSKEIQDTHSVTLEQAQAVIEAACQKATKIGVTDAVIGDDVAGSKSSSETERLW